MFAKSTHRPARTPTCRRSPAPARRGVVHPVGRHLDRPHRVRPRAIDRCVRGGTSGRSGPPAPRRCRDGAGGCSGHGPTTGIGKGRADSSGSSRRRDLEGGKASAPPSPSVGNRGLARQRVGHPDGRWEKRDQGGRRPVRRRPAHRRSRRVRLAHRSRAVSGRSAPTEPLRRSRLDRPALHLAGHHRVSGSGGCDRSAPLDPGTRRTPKGGPLRDRPSDGTDQAGAGLRSPCPHRACRPRPGQRPSPACPRPRLRWSGTARRWTQRSAGRSG